MTMFYQIALILLLGAVYPYIQYGDPCDLEGTSCCDTAGGLGVCDCNGEIYIDVEACAGPFSPCSWGLQAQYTCDDNDPLCYFDCV